MVQIIGAGLCRTGTSSTLVALEKLQQGPCYHYNEVSLIINLDVLLLFR